MPYSKSTQKDYGDNPLQKRSGFKMKGMSFGNSPLQQDKKKKNDDAEYKRKVKEANAKLIAKFKAKHKAGEITNQELIDAVKEIRQYVDY